MMDKFSIKAFLSSMTLLSAFALTGCDQAPQEDRTNIQSEQAIEQNMSDEIIQSSSVQDTQNLSKGNMLNIARDIAKLQLETDDYIALLKQSQNSLEQAIQNKNVQQLKATSGDLNQELHGLHDTLLSLNLKSNEIDQIRQNLLVANQQLLNMPLLHGQFDLAKINFEQIEKQLNTIQMDMVKLASLVLKSTNNTQNSAA
ncbi:hypothetical protein F959_03139 [Acinetobacter venetianus RAG-1 = CIP 110063]|uniref:Lipoprotein n=1 Tax=Acinetobacter venetianus (strain ATCC 31012 / DSM 23050 / BCRC 14357 / CCUG 45561 / CIP 110063 / KCTC 2702 / LMG 19082 / RAG-1) TaxID=1191460 RepID=N8ZPV1_ACIVR|nr:hypothetical protein [Acinetobacter venetianus]ENV35789.1 hypothetical protein F959_03139 [Acinetobacter venetianus RAG-1 = CIP 110063]